MKQLMKYYDVDGDGHISYEEFVKGLRDSLSARKQRIVDTAFLTLDRENAGALKLAYLAQVFDGSSFPEVLNGKKSRDQLVHEFLSQFHGSGAITRANW
jgi:Ca2+-binding EF-hand superfamily protein